VLIAVAITGVVTLTALAKSYAHMLLKVSQFNNLRVGREVLEAKYQLLQRVVEHTNTQLDSLESLASEVAVGYGMENQPRPPLPRQSLAAVLPVTGAWSSRYDASLYAFNIIERKADGPARNSSLLGLLANPLVRPASIPTIWPVRGEVTAGFGERVDPFSGEEAFHPGLDIAAPEGTPVRAAADGIVVAAGRTEPGYGNEILIDHGSDIATRYGHLQKIFVVEGQEVKQGQVIGTIGMTGRTTGPHLHYEGLVRDTPVNPAKFLRG
jgi:murein DD-endopeptidase MepM/ murein hydrolase activator NlpD